MIIWVVVPVPCLIVDCWLLLSHLQKLGPRERLLEEFETMELTDLRLQLRDVETLLRNLEGPSGEGTAVTATANGSTKNPPLTPATIAISIGDKASETSHDPGPTGEIDTGTGAARAGSHSKDTGKECTATKGGPDGCGTRRVASSSLPLRLHFVHRMRTLLFDKCFPHFPFYRVVPSVLLP